MTKNDKNRPKTAKENFAGPLNCAQAVAMAFQDLSGISAADIENHRHSGGGRAPGGICGALHAGLELLHDANQRETLIDQFATVTGSKLCREIRSAKVMSCADCVEAAATILTVVFEQNGTYTSKSSRQI